MARPRKLVPTLQHHKATGQARVRLPDGSTAYLGRWGGKQSREAYARLCAELAAGATSRTVSAGRSARKASNGPTVAEVFQAWREHAERHYTKNGRPTGQSFAFRAPIKAARELYGMMPAVEFGPLKLEAVRAELLKPFIHAGRGDKPQRRSRTTVNRQARLLVSVFKWAASREMIPASVPQALATLAPLRAGRTDAPETEPVGPVADSVIVATCAKLSRVVADMVKLARVTGMRPGELCGLRPCDVDRSGPIWRYVPSSHKLEHHGKSRAVFIGPKGREILAPYLDRSPEAFCFSPREAAAQVRARRRAERVTPDSCGSKPGANRRRKPAREPGERFTSGTFRRAIVRAAQAAKVEPWHPNQLRHTFATEARTIAGLEAVQGLLGHSNLSTSQIYAERHEALAVEVVERIG